MYKVLSLHRLASNNSIDDDDDDHHHRKGHVHLLKAYTIVQTVYSLSLTIIIIIIVVIAVVRERTAQHACAKIARSKQHRTQEHGTW